MRLAVVSSLLLALAATASAASQPTITSIGTRHRVLFRHAATAEDSPGRHEALREELLLLSSSSSTSSSSASSTPPSRRLRRLLSPTKTWAGRKLLLSESDSSSPLFSLSFGSLGSHVAVDYVDVPDAEAAAELAGLLSGRPSSHFAELDGVVKAATAPDDARVAEQYYLNQGGLYSDSIAAPTPEEERAGKGVAPGAWNRTLGSEQVVVCVMDSGIDYDHPDLRENMWTNTKEIPGNGLDDDGNGYVDDVHGINTFTVGGGTVADDFFHGTHLAGIVGASCNNRIGVCGVSPVVRLMGCKFLDGAGNGYTSDAVRCLNYAIAMGADVTLNSYGGLAADSQALRAAISAAGVAGQLFVAAAGNDYGTNIDLDGGTPTFPASYDSKTVLTVIATDRSGERIANFSNWGATAAAIAAPGQGILSTVPGGSKDNGGSGGNYALHDGTSQAAAQVAGAAALLLAARRQAGYSRARAADVRDDLLLSARRVDSLKGKCSSGGVLDVAAAMARAPREGPRDPRESAWLRGVAERTSAAGAEGRVASTMPLASAAAAAAAASGSSSSSSSAPTLSREAAAAAAAEADAEARRRDGLAATAAAAGGRLPSTAHTAADADALVSAAEKGGAAGSSSALPVAVGKVVGGGMTSAATAAVAPAAPSTAMKKAAAPAPAPSSSAAALSLFSPSSSSSFSSSSSSSDSRVSSFPEIVPGDRSTLARGQTTTAAATTQGKKAITPAVAASAASVASSSSSALPSLFPPPLFG